MNVAAIQSIVSRQRAVEQAQMLAALRRSRATTGSATRVASFVAQLDRPFDASAVNLPPVTATHTVADFQTGLLA
jgi:hypothetical protein